MGKWRRRKVCVLPLKLPISLCPALAFVKRKLPVISLSLSFTTVISLSHSSLAAAGSFSLCDATADVQVAAFLCLDWRQIGYSLL
ncbi:unnamed protein product [Citrullus colocynthis]|uniref:Secreted protein n=1 Tax=Citrullus colocynthis TaxID=252529 RepID=A0ABP0Z4R5_9ROSI